MDGAVVIVEALTGGNATCAAVVEEEGLGDDVGGVEAGDTEGYDIVEGGGGADVDEADDAGGHGRDDDCVDRDRGAFLDLIL